MYFKENLNREEKQNFMLFQFVSLFYISLCLCVNQSLPGGAGTANVVLWNHTKTLSFLVKDKVFIAFIFYNE